MLASSETSYFTLRPCDKQIGLTDPKPEPSVSTAETGYLSDLGLPSLPPLSQLLTDDKNSATQNLDPLPTPVIRALVEAQQQQEYFSTSSPTSSIAANSSVHTSIAPSAVSAMPDSLAMMAPVTTTAPLSMLMDPTSMYLPPQDDLAAVETTAALMATNPTANPSSFYNIAPSSPVNTTSPDSFMVPSTSTGDSLEKNYSFVAIPGANQRKRPRRRYDEIERLYHCTWPNCTKSYGTLNHLNAHVSMQKHGAKRHPSEFKEMRKNWRRQKKEREAARKATEKENLASSSVVNTMNVNMATGSTHTTTRSCYPFTSYAPYPAIYSSLPQSIGSAFY